MVDVWRWAVRKVLLYINMYIIYIQKQISYIYKCIYYIYYIHIYIIYAHAGVATCRTIHRQACSPTDMELCKLEVKFWTMQCCHLVARGNLSLVVGVGQYQKRIALLVL